MLGFLARGAHDSDYSTSVSTYRRVFDAHCTITAPFAVTSSCVLMISCNFDGDHIYLSGHTTYSPSNICSSSSSYSSSSSSSYSPSSYSPSSSSSHVSYTGLKWLFYIFVLLPCYIICKCCCKKDDPPAAMGANGPSTVVRRTILPHVIRVSILGRCGTTSAHSKHTKLPPLRAQTVNVAQSTNTAQAAQPNLSFPAPATPQVIAAPQVMAAPQTMFVHGMAAPLQPVQQLSSSQPTQFTPQVQQTSNPLSSTEKGLGEFLNELNLSQYETGLRKLGITDPAHLVDLEAADCEACGMKSLEVKRLMRCVGAGVVAL